MAAIPLHIWRSRIDALKTPDWCILDLDPTEAPFEHVVNVALEIKSFCETREIPTFIKTSGGKGVHILIPMEAKYSYEQVKMFAELVARLVIQRLPDIATIERRLENRIGKVYIDYVQNGYGKLLVAPYCVRPFPGAPVSTPIYWGEVTPSLAILDFNIKTVPERLREIGEDPLAEVLSKGIELE